MVEDDTVVVRLGSRAGSVISLRTVATSTIVRYLKHRVVSSDPFQYVCSFIFNIGIFEYFSLIFEISHRFWHMQGVG